MKQAGRIVLASSSPRRKAFLDQLGLKVDVIPSDVAEVGYGGDPALLPQRITLQKVKAVQARLGPEFLGWIIGADTVVSLDREIFGKPEDADQAKAMLRKLSGKRHQVFTGFRVQGSDGDFRQETVLTQVDMAPMTDAEINWYVATGEPNDKAGAYAIQGTGGLFVRSIEGSYSNVVGLPLHELMGALRAIGAITD